MCLRFMLFTAMFFHTPLESFVGLFVASAVAFIPLCSHSFANYYASIVYSQQK
jgi:hypothetical protein